MVPIEEPNGPAGSPYDTQFRKALSDYGNQWQGRKLVIGRIRPTSGGRQTLAVLIESGPIPLFHDTSTQRPGGAASNLSISPVDAGHITVLDDLAGQANALLATLEDYATTHVVETTSADDWVAMIAERSEMKLLLIQIENISDQAMRLIRSYQDPEL